MGESKMGPVYDQRLFSIFDRKQKEFGQILASRGEEAIRRTIVEGVRGSGSLVEKYPEDFDLFCVGFFDTDTGVIEAATAPLLIDNVAIILGGARNGAGSEES